MTEQLDFFKKSAQQKDDETFTKDYCMQGIRSAEYLWDMRAWHKAYDRDEVAAWVKGSKDGKNDGHVRFCIDRLKTRGVAESEIVDAILENKKIKYKNRLVPCFLVECEKAKKNGGYGGETCSECTETDKTARRKTSSGAGQKAGDN